jgi:MoaE-MoaD fusion protein
MTKLTMSITTDFFEVTHEPIDIGAIVRRVVPAECGATVALDEYVRKWAREKETLRVVYEAYEPMALVEMKRVANKARDQFEIGHIGIVHRLGKLAIGETSVVIAVAAPHRAAAFAACEWLIGELKRTVPIWKKEFYVDGGVWAEADDETLTKSRSPEPAGKETGDNVPKRSLL